MDVAKYIGLFLLKNNFCYVHGLGNLELKKKPASYNGDALIPPGYDVSLSPSGSIDDNLANFIASNEQISISKASNALRDFSTQARADIAAGKSVGIPAIGTFYEDEGKIRFATDPNLRYTPPPISVAKVNKAIDQPPVLPLSTKTETGSDSRPYVPVHTPSEEDDDTPKLNWTRIILAGVVLIALAAIVTYGVKKYKGGEDTLQPVLPTTKPVENVAPIPDSATAATMVDSNSIDSRVVGGDGREIKFNAIIESYSNLKKAQDKVNKMRGWGHPVELAVEDTGKYFVVLPVKCRIQDTAKVLDSLSKIYNPAGVTIY
jgi:nucleoid DNA-binding protein